MRKALNRLIAGKLRLKRTEFVEEEDETVRGNQVFPKLDLSVSLRGCHKSSLGEKLRRIMLLAIPVNPCGKSRLHGLCWEDEKLLIHSTFEVSECCLWSLGDMLQAEDTLKEQVRGKWQEKGSCASKSLYKSAGVYWNILLLADNWSWPLRYCDMGDPEGNIPSLKVCHYNSL